MLHSRERASKRASEPSTNNCGAGPVIHKKGSIITVKIRLDFKTRKEHSRPFLATDKHSWFMINMRALLIWQIYCISCRISVEAFFFLHFNVKHNLCTMRGARRNGDWSPWQTGVPQQACQSAAHLMPTSSETTVHPSLKDWDTQVYTATYLFVKIKIDLFEWMSIFGGCWETSPGPASRREGFPR